MYIVCIFLNKAHICKIQRWESLVDHAHFREFLTKYIIFILFNLKYNFSWFWKCQLISSLSAFMPEDYKPSLHGDLKKVSVLYRIYSDTWNVTILNFETEWCININSNKAILLYLNSIIVRYQGNVLWHPAAVAVAHYFFNWLLRQHMHIVN